MLILKLQTIIMNLGAQIIMCIAFYDVLVDISYIPASIHNEAMLSGAWTSIAQ